MSLKTSKVKTTTSEPKLSKFGKNIVFIVLAVIFSLVSFFAYSSCQKKAKEKEEQNLFLAIERAEKVCKNVLTELSIEDSSVLDEFESYKKRISKEKNITKKADIAVEMIGFVSSFNDSNKNITAELTGSSNRIFVALSEYEKK